MARYIELDALLAEIERRRDAALMRQQNLEAIGQETVINKMVANELNRIISFIDTLKVKEVDLKKELSYEEYKSFFENHPDFPDDWGFDEAFIFAKYFYSLGLKAQKGE
jgi:hypothetical protein